MFFFDSLELCETMGGLWADAAGQKYHEVERKPAGRMAWRIIMRISMRRVRNNKIRSKKNRGANFPQESVESRGEIVFFSEFF